MADDLEGRVDKLSEAVGVLSERVTRVEHEQRAMRSSIDQLAGDVRQIDKRFGDFDKRLGEMSHQIDKRLGDFDKRLGDFDRRLEEMSHQFDKRMELLDKRITDVKWVIGLGMGLIVLLMTLYRFLQLPVAP